MGGFMKNKPSQEQMELVKAIAEKVTRLAIKEQQLEICAIIPYSMIKTLIITAEAHKQWDLLILLADLIPRLMNLINEADVPLDALADYGNQNSTKEPQ